MSERGQKIFKWIVWLVIVILVVVKVLGLRETVSEFGVLMN